MKPRVYPSLQAYMEGTGITQEQLAAKLQMKQGTLSRLLNGLWQPKLHTALKISEVTKVPVESMVIYGEIIPVSQETESDNG